MVMDFASRGSLYDVLMNPRNNIDWFLFFKFAESIGNAIHSIHTWTPCVVHRYFFEFSFYLFSKFF